MNTVFLGGTCGKNTWRDGLIQRLMERGVPKEALFNPVVEHWDEEAQRREDLMKVDQSVFMLYMLADPMTEEGRLSFYSLLEATMGLYDEPHRTAVVFDSTRMPSRSAKSNDKACADLKKRFPGAPIFGSLAGAEDWIVQHLDL